MMMLGRATGPWLLGIDWGHLPIFEKVKEPDGKTDVSEKYVVQSNSGQMAVAPAWKLYDLLHLDEFVANRRERDQELAKLKAKTAVVSDSQPPTA